MPGGRGTVARPQDVGWRSEAAGFEKLHELKTDVAMKRHSDTTTTRYYTS